VYATKYQEGTDSCMNHATASPAILHVTNLCMNYVTGFSNYDSANKLTKEGQCRLSQHLNINLVQSPEEGHAQCDN